MNSLTEVVNAYPVAVVATLAVGAMLAALLFGGSGGKKKPSPVALQADTFQPFELVEKTIISHDTRIFRFKLHHDTQRLGLPIGQHMYLKANINGKDVQRAYTPISSDDDVGHFNLLIKVYFANVHPKFPEGGKMTQHLEAMKIGESISVRGPTGRFEYVGNSNYVQKVGRELIKKSAPKIGMIAGGSGITPMYQIIKAILKNPDDKTEVFLVFANQTEEDILLRKELEECAKDPRVHLWYTLDRPTGSWKYSEGFINYEMVNEHMPSPDGGSIVLMCGPPPMITYACKPNLQKMGFADDAMFTF